MTPLKIKTTDFLNAAIATYAQKFLDIINAIINNPTVFLDCPYLVTTLEENAAEMATTTSDAAEGGRVQRDLRDQQRTACDAILLTLSNFVLLRTSKEETLEDQIAIVHLSKFVLAKNTITPAPPLPQVENVKGTWTGNEGEALIEWNKISEGVLNYKVQKCFTNALSPDAVWIDVAVTSHRKIVIDGLPQLTKFWVRVIAYGKGTEKSVPSDPAVCVMG